MSSGNISYIYDATGVKLEKVVTEGVNITRTKYAGNFIYEKIGTAVDVLKFFSQPEGYVEPDGSAYNYIYQYKDHLGNIRLSYKDISLTSTPSLQIVEENNYYPFGLKHKGYNSNINGTHHKYMFGGKELSEELGLNTYDFGARNYDAALGRWMNSDPLAEMYFENSNYTYVLNNPMFFKDPNGEKVWIYYENEDGKQQRAEYRNNNFYSKSGDKINVKGNEFLKNSLKSLNDMNSTEIGNVVLGDLIKSKNNFDIKNKTTHEEATAGFYANKDSKGNYTGGGTLALGNSQDLNTVAHESFHAYQYENGTGGANINNEVEGYLFGTAVETQYAFNKGAGSFGSGNVGRDNSFGKSYEKAMDDLLFSGELNIKSFKTAVDNFKNGSTKNREGVYKNFSVKPIDPKKILISKFYPLIR